MRDVRSRLLNEHVKSPEVLAFCVSERGKGAKNKAKGKSGIKEQR